MKNTYLLPDDIRLELLRDFIDFFSRRTCYIHRFVCLEFINFLKKYGIHRHSFTEVFPEYKVIKNTKAYFQIWLTDNDRSLTDYEKNLYKIYALELLYNYIKTNKKQLKNDN